MDGTDTKLLAVLDANSRSGIRAIAKQLRIAEETVRYRMNRLEQKGVIKHYHTLMDYTRLGYHAYCVYARFTGTEREEALKTLEAHPRVYWIASFAVAYDLSFSLFARSPEEFERVASELFASLPGVVPYDIVLKIGARKFERSYLPGVVPGKQERRRDAYELSTTDRHVLRALGKHARIPALTIAQEHKLPVSSVVASIKRLERDGIILGYTVVLDASTFGRQSYQVNVSLQNSAGIPMRTLESFAAASGNLVVAVHVLGPWQLELIFETADLQELQRTLQAFNAQFGPLVKHMQLVPIFEDYRKMNHYPFTD